MLIIKNVSLFDGTSLQKNKTVITSNTKILDIKTSLCQISNMSSKTKVIDGKENLLIPGFIDIQLNGGGGALFNKTPTTLALDRIFKSHLQYGTTSFFPTFLSDTFENTQKAVTLIEKLAKQKSSGVIGLHLEGPLLNTVKKGIHAEQYITNKSEKYLDLIIRANIQKRLMTIAPEIVGKEHIRKLNKKGIFIFAGHTAATGEEMQKYFREGVGGVTHLFNACSQITARDIGVVGASLLEPNMSTLIVDGIHVSDDALRIAFKIKETKYFALISDSMELIGTKKKSFNLHNDLISLRNNTLKNCDGTLAGAHLTMLWAFQNLLQKKLVTLTEAISMTSTNQAKYFGLNYKGAILPKFDANMLLIDKNNFKLLKVMFLGKLIDINNTHPI